MNVKMSSNNNFCDLSNEEMMMIDGGNPAVGFLVGLVAGNVISAVLKEETGMNLEEWSRLGYRKAKKEWKKWEEKGGAFGLLVDALGW